MNEEILINVTPQETRVAVMQQGVVQELHIERGSQRGLVGNVYVGKVSACCPACSLPSSTSDWNDPPSCT